MIFGWQVKRIIAIFTLDQNQIILAIFQSIFEYILLLISLHRSKYFENMYTQIIYFEKYCRFPVHLF